MACPNDIKVKVNGIKTSFYTTECEKKMQGLGFVHLPSHIYIYIYIYILPMTICDDYFS